MPKEARLAKKRKKAREAETDAGGPRTPMKVKEAIDGRRGGAGEQRNEKPSKEGIQGSQDWLEPTAYYYYYYYYYLLNTTTRP